MHYDAGGPHLRAATTGQVFQPTSLYILRMQCSERATNVTKQTSGGTNTQSKAGVLTEIVRNAQLAWRLLADRRVSLLLKLIIPGLMLGYLILPTDIFPDFIPVIGQLDDLAILALGIKIFIELAPKDIVREYRGEWADIPPAGPAEPNGSGETVDAEYRVVK
jgi:uncharacterized membrane protein YkvA (DUF1232 family)